MSEKKTDKPEQVKPEEKSSEQKPTAQKTTEAKTAQQAASASSSKPAGATKQRSEERRVGKECRAGWRPYQCQKQKIGQYLLRRCRDLEISEGCCIKRFIVG